MTDIQQARDVLASWRDDIERADQAWALSTYNHEMPSVVDDQGSGIADALLLGDARLIVGTAGNPELLDAIDGMLAAAVLVGRWEPEFLAHAKRIAAAIIAADERMSA